MEEPAVDVESQLGLQSGGQLSLDLLLVGVVALVLGQKEQDVPPDRQEELVRYSAPLCVAAQLCLALVPDVLSTVDVVDEVREGAHEARKDNGGHEEQARHKEGLYKVQGEDVTVAHGGHGRQREV